MRRTGKWLWWSLLLLAGLYFFFGLISDLRLFHRYEQQQLQHLALELQQEIAQAAGPSSGGRDLTRLLRERRLVNLELLLRRFYLDYLMAGLGAGALLFLLGQWVRGGQRHHREIRVRTADDLQVAEGKPREEYVDEYEFQRRQAAGFATREEAVHWLTDATATTCDYCGGKLVSAPGTPKAYVEQVTFYKKVPAGAKDLRVVMGNGWFAHAAPDVVCGGCGRQLNR